MNTAFIKEQFLYLSRIYSYIPITFTKRVILGKDEYWRQYFWNRWGFLPPALVEKARQGINIWIDANAGEAVQAMQLCRGLKEALAEYNIFFSSNNYETLIFAKEKAGKQIDYVFDTPWDTTFAVRQAIKKVRPKALIFIENCFYPILARNAKKRGIVTILASAIMNDAFLKLPAMVRSMGLRFFDYIDFFLAKSEMDKEGFIKIGVPENKISVFGSLKYDLDYLNFSEQMKEELRRKIHIKNNDLVIVAGPVRRGEEGIIVEAFYKIYQRFKNAFLILVPRYMKDIPQIEDALKQYGLAYSLRTKLSLEQSPFHRAIIVDTFGELVRFYSIATVNIVGGSFCLTTKAGLGHNIIEPLLQRKPVFFGPYMNRWREITSILSAAYPGLETNSADGLASGITEILTNKEAYDKVCRTESMIIEDNKDNLERYLDFIKHLLNKK